MDCDPERIWKIVESHRQNVQKKKRQAGAMSLFDHLHDCYVECTQNYADKSFDKRFRSAVNLLQHVPPEHARPSLIVNLRSDEEGYSFMLCPNDDGEPEEIFFPYEDNEIFSYLDNQEIPPVLLEVLEKTQHCNMYCGCVVCEVRDYRSPSQADGSSYNRHLLLLRPTAETILATVNEIAHETKCSPEEKLFLESRLLLATQPPLCLDPSTDVVCVTNRLQFNRRKFHTPSMRRYLRRRSQANRARMHLVSEGEAPEKLRLHDFILKQRATPPIRRDYSNCWKKPKLLNASEPCNLEKIAEDVFKHAKVVSEPPVATSHHHHPPPPVPPSSALPLQQPRQQEDTTNVSRMAPSLQTAFADELLTINKVVQEPPPDMKQELPSSSIHQGVQTITQPPPPQPTQQTPPTLSRLGAIGLQPALLNLFRAQSAQQLPSSRKNRPIVPALSPGTAGRTPGISATAAAIQRLAAQAGVLGASGSVSGQPQMPPLQVVRGQSGTVVLVSRAVGTPGQPATPGYVSVQHVSTRGPVSEVRASTTMTPPLKAAPTSVRTATPSPPTLHTPPKLRPPNLPTLKQGTAVQTTMPKLKPLTQELPKPSQPTAPVPASGKSPTPAMPQLKKIATGAPQPTPLTAGTMKNSPLVAKQPSETQVPQLHAAKSNK